MKFVLRLTKKEVEAMKKASKEVKSVFNKIKGSFKIEVIDNDKNKSTIKSKKSRKIKKVNNKK